MTLVNVGALFVGIIGDKVPSSISQASTDTYCEC